MALAQARMVVQAARQVEPRGTFELKVVETSGDRLATATARTEAAGPAGLFAKELEVELLSGGADIAVHSLKDLPTEVPEGLELAGTLSRADAREVLLYRSAVHVAGLPPLEEWSPGMRLMRGFEPGMRLAGLPPGAVVATNSTRRAALLRRVRPDTVIEPIRGNVGTRLNRLMADATLDATFLALAGLQRLRWTLGPHMDLRLDPFVGAAAGVTLPPEGVLGTVLEVDEMVPAVGQGALGLEIRSGDAGARQLVSRLNHGNSWRCVLAERAFLRALGGGCQSAVGAHARVVGHRIEMQAVVVREGLVWSGQARRALAEGEKLGIELAGVALQAGR